MKKFQILFTTILFVVTFGTLAVRSAQDTPAGANDPDAKRNGLMLGLVRSINTSEVGEVDQYGSYSSWPMLLVHNQQLFDGWVKKNYPSDDPNVRLSDGREILPGFNLRLNVQADGKGYVVLLIDENDKNGFAAVSDESGIIRLCKFLQ